MTGLLICAALVAFAAVFAWCSVWAVELHWRHGKRLAALLMAPYGLALIAVALWLAYAAGTLTNRNHDMTDPNDTPVRYYDR